MFAQRCFRVRNRNRAQVFKSDSYGDACRCTGAGFRESDTCASPLHWDLQFQSGVLEVLNRAVTSGYIGICSCKVASKAPFL